MRGCIPQSFGLVSATLRRLECSDRRPATVARAAAGQLPQEAAWLSPLRRVGGRPMCERRPPADVADSEVAIPQPVDDTCFCVRTEPAPAPPVPEETSHCAANARGG